MAGPAKGESPRQYWLVKTEPETYGWEQQVAAGTEPWSGVRNHLAKNNLKAMRAGDLALFYHSGAERQVVGVVEVARPAYPDPTAGQGEWLAVDMRTVGKLPEPVTLAAMRADPALEGLALLRNSRLSVVAVSAAHWARICRLGGWQG